MLLFREHPDNVPPASRRCLPVHDTEGISRPVFPKPEKFFSGTGRALGECSMVLNSAPPLMILQAGGNDLKRAGDFRPAPTRSPLPMAFSASLAPTLT